MSLLWLAGSLATLLVFPSHSFCAETESVTVFVAPNPSAPYCEYTSYSHKSMASSTNFFDVYIYPGTVLSGECTTTTSPILPQGKLLAGPSNYVLSLSVDDFPTVTGRIQSCTAISALTDGAGSTTGSIMGCSESQQGTLTRTETIPTTYTVHTLGLTLTSTQTRVTETATFTDRATWTAALAAQTTVEAGYFYTDIDADYERRRPNIGLIVGITVPCTFLLIGLLWFIQYRLAKRILRGFGWGPGQGSYTVSYNIGGAQRSAADLELQNRQDQELAELRAMVQTQENTRNKTLEAQVNAYSGDTLFYRPPHVSQLSPLHTPASTSSLLSPGIPAPSQSAEIAQLHARIAQLEAERNTTTHPHPPPYNS